MHGPTRGGGPSGSCLDREDRVPHGNRGVQGPCAFLVPVLSRMCYSQVLWRGLETFKSGRGRV